MRTVTFPMTETECRKLDLSYYTLCRLSDVTRFANPMTAAPSIHGTLTLDALGNFRSFSPSR